MRSVYSAAAPLLLCGRTPLVSVTAIRDIFANDEPLQALRKFLQTQPSVRLAIRIASPSLADALKSWLEGANQTSNAPLRALAYVDRLAARPTPFGMCAGVGVVEAGDRTTLRLAAPSTCTRPDMEVLAKIASQLETGTRRGAVCYSTNAAMFERGGRLYVTNLSLSSLKVSDGHLATQQRPVSLKNTPAVQFVRALAIEPLAYDELAGQVAERFAASVDEARRLLDKLIDAGLLLSELRVSPVDDPIAQFISRAQRIEPDLATELQQALEASHAFDRQPLDERSEASYCALIDAFRALLGERVENALQVDMRVPFLGTIGRGILSDAARLGDYLMRSGSVCRLKRFRERFIARYEGDERLVPLLELVDPNVGLGAPDDLDFEKASPARDALALRLACEALRDETEEIELSGGDLEVLLPPLSPTQSFPPIEVGFQVAADSYDAMDRGDYLVTSSGFTGAMGVARGLGRFMHILGPETLERARTVARERAATGAIATDFVFVPSTARNYNVSIRPRLHETEIRVNVGGPSSSNEIPLDDLWVGLDNEQFFLWWASRKCRIAPREGHVFATDRLAPNLCRFLSLLADDGERMLRPFNWGPASNFTYLPRVRIGRVIVSPRRWRFAKVQLGNSLDEITNALDRLRTRWRIPQYVQLSDGDNTLLLDLLSSVTAALLMDQLGKLDEHVEFSEAIPTPAQTWVTGATGAHVAEFVMTLVARPGTPTPSRIEPKPITGRRARSGPGSAWLYAKLYCGAQASDDVLLRAIGPLLCELRAEERIDRWFFLRYADPDTHVRIRMHILGDIPEVRERFLTAAEAWLENDVLQRYALETYDPEYERYGGAANIEAVERFFTLDSERCLQLLATLPDSSDARIACAAESFHAWIVDGGLGDLTLEAFAQARRRKLEPTDRDALRRIGARGEGSGADMGLAQALVGPDPSRRLASLFHMHCNRLDVSGASEGRAIALLRALVVARKERSASLPRAPVGSV